MCGIAGIALFDPADRLVADELEAMCDTVVHRGPDESGCVIRDGVALGMRRLSVIDPVGGSQPISNEDGTVQVVLNGEIYNFPELRTELENHGHRFRTSSDTEVIVHGYKQWGDGILERMNGMFGLAIWDAEKRRLVVARDAMGIKMIYYRLDNGRLTFGSEIRAVQAADPDKTGIDPEAVREAIA